MFVFGHIARKTAHENGRIVGIGDDPVTDGLCPLWMRMSTVWSSPLTLT